MKQETIEEAAERILANNIDGLRDAYYDGSQDAPIKKGQSYQYYNQKFKKD